MSVSQEKLVLYTGECLDGVLPTDSGTRMQLDVTKMTIVPVPISGDIVEKVKEYSTKVTKLFQEALKLGKTLLTDKRKQAGLESLVGVGQILLGIIKFIPNLEVKDPVVESLKEMEENVKKLGEKVASNLDEMKAFVSEVKFFMNIITPTSVLIKHMRDCLTFPGPDSHRNFKKAYYEHPPLELAYTLINYLGKSSTNPLRLAMAAEKAKLRSTFNKWEDIICRLLGQFVLLQTFANGILGFKEDTNYDLLFEGSDKIVKNMEEWRQEYEASENQGYWEDFKNRLESYIISFSHLNNLWRGEEICNKLRDYFTKDAFYVCVFNDCNLSDFMTYYCPNKDSQVIECWHKGNCNVFVYRSHTAHQKVYEDYRKCSSALANARDSGLSLDKPVGGALHSQLANKPILTDYGFIGLVDRVQEPYGGYVNAPHWTIVNSWPECGFYIHSQTWATQYFFNAFFH